MPTTITMKTDTLLVMLQAHLVTASKDVTREHLNGVLVSMTSLYLTLASTDGHRLLESRCSESTECVGELHDTILPLAGVVGMIATLKAAKKAKVETCELSFDSPANRWSLAVGDSAANYGGSARETQFPPYSKVIPPLSREPELGQTLTHIGVNAEYMQDLTRVFPARGKGGETPVRMAWGGQLDPLRFDCETPSLCLTQVYVVMPMRV
jgi:hypothetical protein